MQKNNLPTEEMLQELLMPRDMWEKPIKSFTQVITITLYHFYIIGEIESEPDRYIEMINTLKTAEQHDQIYIYLNTPGGDLATTIQIISAIKQSAANVITVIEGECCSAGTLIFLSGDDYIVNDHCTLMIHNYSHGPFGKGNEVKSAVNYSDKYFKKLSNDFYKDFLTPEEIDAVCEDKDFWMETEEILERLERKGVDIKESIGEIESEIFADEDDEEDPPPTKRKRRQTATKKK